jgi:gluconolactonase
MLKKHAILPLVALIVFGCTPPPAAEPEAPSTGSVERLDPALDGIVPQGAEIEKLATGFSFIEGPLWRADGSVWFSDVVGNVVRQYAADGTVTEVLRPGGYDGNSLPAGGFVGPNGMTFDKDGSVLLCQHGNRRIARIAPDGTVTTLVDSFEGKKLNSPNDLVFHRDGSLYFTDPPYGLPQQDDDPTKELDFNGVYRLSPTGELQVLVTDMTRPNGIAFSPDYQTLYVANSDEAKRLWMAYDVNADGTLSNGRVFADVSAEPAAGLPDGMKVDQLGNVYGTGPGGVWIFNAEGKHLGTIAPPEGPANVAWGDDGSTLYMTAVTSLYRIKLSAPGMRPLYGPSPRGIELHVDLNVDPAQEAAFLQRFETEFRPAAAKQPGFVDLEMLKLNSALMGQTPRGMNYRFVLSFRSEPQRQAWVATDLHQQVWPALESMLASKDYTVTLFNSY